MAGLKEVLGQAVVELTTEDKTGPGLDKAKKEVETQAKGMGEKFSDLGDKLKPVSVAAAGVAAGATVMAQSWNDAQRGMAATTGATGAKLDGLMESVQNVVGTVKGGIGGVSDVMSEIAAKTELTGAPLERLTQQILALKEIGMEVTAADVGAAFGRWAIPADQWAGSLERVFRISQETGVSMQTLLGRIAEGAPIMQGLGFSFEQSSLLAAKLGDDALPGLRKALVDIAKAHGNSAELTDKATTAQEKYSEAVAEFGPDSNEAMVASNKLDKANHQVALGMAEPMEAVKELVASIRDAGTTMDGEALAVAAFGKKAGPELALLIRNGKFDVDALSAAVEANGNTALKTAEDNRSLLDQIMLFKDKAAGAIAPYADKLAVVATIITGLSPAAKGLGVAFDWIKGFGGAASAAGAGMTVMAAGNTAEGAAAAAAAVPTASLAAAVWAVTWPVLAVIAAIAALVGIFFLLRDVVGLSVPETINVMLLLVPGIGTVLAAAMFLFTHWEEIWGWITGVVDTAVDWLLARWDELTGAISGVADAVLGALKGAWDWIVQAAKDIIEWVGKAAGAVKDFAGEAAKAAFEMTPIGMGLGAVGIHLAEGGIVPGPLGAPVPAIVHGGELVVPPGDIGDFGHLDGLTGGSRGGGVTVIHNHIAGTVIAERDLQRSTMRAAGPMRRGGWSP